MGIKANFPTGQIRRHIQNQIPLIEQGIILALASLGEQLVNHARSLDTYKDQTGNLRSSIGYVIAKNGKVVKDYFPGEKPTGTNTGRTFASLESSGKKGFSLIVVAGMEYAAKVESRGYDVIASAELISMAEIPDLRRRIQTIIRTLR